MLEEKQIHSFPCRRSRFLSLIFYHLVVTLIPEDSLSAVQIKHANLGSSTSEMPPRLGGPGSCWPVWCHRSWWQPGRMGSTCCFSNAYKNLECPYYCCLQGCFVLPAQPKDIRLCWGPQATVPALFLPWKGLVGGLALAFAPLCTFWGLGSWHKPAGEGLSWSDDASLTFKA